MGAANIYRLIEEGVREGETLDFTSTLAIKGPITTTDGVASGTARKVGGLASASVAASTAQLGTVETETNFDTTYTLPANTLKAGTVVRIVAQGIHTATTSTESHTILLKLGSTTIVSKASIDPADNDIFYFDCTLVCRTAGTSGTFVAAGVMAAAVPLTGTCNPFLKGSTAVDTTAALVIAVAIDRQASAADTDSARLDILAVTVYG